MKIDFENIAVESLPRFKGGDLEVEAQMFYDGQTRVMYGRLRPGASIGMHTHDTSMEVMFITAGRGHVIYDGERIDLAAGDCHYCPKGHAHTLVNDSDEDLCIRAVVSNL